MALEEHRDIEWDRVNGEMSFKKQNKTNGKKKYFN